MNGEAPRTRLPPGSTPLPPPREARQSHSGSIICKRPKVTFRRICDGLTRDVLDIHLSLYMVLIWSAPTRLSPSLAPPPSAAGGSPALLKEAQANATASHHLPSEHQRSSRCRRVRPRSRRTANAKNVVRSSDAQVGNATKVRNLCLRLAALQHRMPRVQLVIEATCAKKLFTN